MKNSKKIPNFKNRQEEAEFWDKADFSQFGKLVKKVRLNVNWKAPKEEILALRLQSDLKEKMEEVAGEMGVQTSTLARMWLIERLRQYKMEE